MSNQDLIPPQLAFHQRQIIMVLLLQNNLVFVSAIYDGSKFFEFFSYLLVELHLVNLALSAGIKAPAFYGANGARPNGAVNEYKPNVSMGSPANKSFDLSGENCVPIQDLSPYNRCVMFVFLNLYPN